MADYNTMTPGSAVADTVQQILQRKRDEQRQMIMDQLGIEKYRTDVANQDRNFDLDKQRTEASVAASNEALNTTLLKRLPRGRTPVSNIKDPRVLALMDQYGLTEEEVDPPVEGNRPTFNAPDPNAIPGTPEEIGSAVQPEIVQSDSGDVPVFRTTATRPNRTMYIGSDDFQKEQDARDRIAALRTNPGLKSRDPLEVLLTGAEGGVNIPQGALPNKTTVLKPGGSIAQELIGRMGDDVVELNYPPQSTAASQPKLWQLENKATGETKSFVGMPADVKPYTDAGWTVRQGNESTARPTPVVDPKFVTAFTTILKQTNINPNQRTAAFNAAKTALISATNSTPEVKQWLSAFADDAKQRVDAGVPLRTYPEALSLAESDIEGITEAERNALASTILLILEQIE